MYRNAYAQELEVTTFVPSRFKTVSLVSQVPEIMIQWGKRVLTLGYQN